MGAVIAMEKPCFTENDEWWFAKGVMHMRRGETYGEPDSSKAFREELTSIVSSVVLREG